MLSSRGCQTMSPNLGKELSCRPGIGSRCPSQRGCWLCWASTGEKDCASCLQVKAMQGAASPDEVMTLSRGYFSDYIVLFHFNLFSCLSKLKSWRWWIEDVSQSAAWLSGCCCSAVRDTEEDVHPQWNVGREVLRSPNAISCPISHSPRSLGEDCLFSIPADDSKTQAIFCWRGLSVVNHSMVCFCHLLRPGTKFCLLLHHSHFLRFNGAVQI